MDKFTVEEINPYIKGYAAHNQAVAVFEFGEVIVNKNFKEIDRVRLVSGGSSCHIEYVGEGMLTAAVQGKRTDPPTPSLILRTLRELSVNHVKGILVIVQACSTDLLNFGLAIERADNDDLRVAFLGVSDDCQNNQYPKGERRGLSGVVLVNKIAGALALTDKTLPNMYCYCSKVIDNLISIGANVKKMLISTPECQYCRKCTFGIDSVGYKKKVVKGMLIVDIIHETVTTLLSQLTLSTKFNVTSGERVVVLVNNLGALKQSEEYVFFRECVTFLNKLNITVVKFYIGPYLYLNYDLDLTVTLLKVFDDDVLRFLDAPCKVTGPSTRWNPVCICTSLNGGRDLDESAKKELHQRASEIGNIEGVGWKPVFQTEPVSVDECVMRGSLRRKCRLSPPIKGPKLRDRASNIVQLCLQFACDALISCEKMLNKMDAEKGDGDTGTRLRILAEVLNKRSCNKKINTQYPFTFFLGLSKLLENTIGSTMGCLYSVIFEAAANTFGEYPEEEDISAEMWLQALENACRAVKKYGNVEMGDKTMYDPLQACATLFRQNSNDGRYIYSFQVGVAKAEEVAAATRRSGCKYPDAGAHAVSIWMRAVCEGIKLRAFE